MSIYVEGITSEITMLWRGTSGAPIWIPEFYPGFDHLMKGAYAKDLGHTAYTDLIELGAVDKFWKHVNESEGPIYYVYTSQLAVLSSGPSGELETLSDLIGRPIKTIYVCLRAIDYAYLIERSAPDIVMFNNPDDCNMAGFYFQEEIELTRMCWHNTTATGRMSHIDNSLSVTISKNTRSKWMRNSNPVPSMSRIYENALNKAMKNIITLSAIDNTDEEYEKCITLRRRAK